jgi:hypothetical protein
MAEAREIHREKMLVDLSSVVAAIGLTNMKLRGSPVWSLGIWSKLLTQALTWSQL